MTPLLHPWTPPLWCPWQVYIRALSWEILPRKISGISLKNCPSNGYFSEWPSSLNNKNRHLFIAAIKLDLHDIYWSLKDLCCLILSCWFKVHCLVLLNYSSLSCLALHDLAIVKIIKIKKNAKMFFFNWKNIFCFDFFFKFF